MKICRGNTAEVFDYDIKKSLQIVLSENAI